MRIVAAIARLLHTPWQRLAGGPRRAPQRSVTMEFRGTPILVKYAGCDAIVTFRVDDWLTPPAARFIIVQTRCGSVPPGRRCFVRVSTPVACALPRHQALVATVSAESAGTTIEMVGLVA